MSTFARRAIFYALALAFLLIGSLATLYAMGYRLSWENVFSPAKIGGLYVRSYPTDVNIELNGEKIKNKSGLFSEGTFVDGLYPQPYRLVLSAPLYRAWQRDIVVRPSLVTEIKYALLIPETAQEVYSENAAEFWPIGKELAVRDTKLGLQFASTTLPGKNILDWSKDGRIILFAKDASYFWLDTRTGTSTALQPLLLKTSLTKPKTVSLDSESGQVVVAKENALALIDVPSQTVQNIATTTKNIEIDNVVSSRYWLAWSIYDKTKDYSQLIVYDKLLNNKRVLEEKIEGKIKQIDWGTDGLLGVLDGRGEFFTYSPGENKLTHIASDGRYFRFSPNGTRVAVFENKSLEIFTFREKDEYWRFNVPSPTTIKEAWWHGDLWHLILAYPEKTVLLDLEDKALQNLEVLATTGKASFESETGFLYYNEEGKIYRLDLGEK